MEPNVLRELPSATGDASRNRETGWGHHRPLGIPTVPDRFIQQALLQVLQQEWDRTFSDSSFGFRPKRSAHQAIKRSQEYLKEGYLVKMKLKVQLIDLGDGSFWGLLSVGN